MKNNNKQQLIKIAPSIFGADFGHLADEAKRTEDAGANWLHIDIMDGNFVPNLTLGPRAVAAINRSTDLFLDVHLMVYHPFDYIEQFVEAGADSITIHFEATEDLEETLDYIKKCNVRRGLAFNPETSMSLIPRYLDSCEMILIMSVNPGFGGQSFIEESLEKVRFTRDVCNQLKIGAEGKPLDPNSNPLPFDIQIDGGVTFDNIQKCTDAGANVIVAGTSLYSAPDLKIAINEMRALSENNFKN